MSEAALYKQLRRDGLGHDAAIERVCDQYGHRGSGASEYVSRWLESARREVEAPAAAAVEPDPEPEPDADPLDELERDANEKIAGLEEQRSRLALDATTDDAHAKAEAAQELRDVESELAAARAELERLPLARAERQRRERQAAAEAERETRQKAGAKIPALGKRVAAAASSVDDCAAKLAASIALHAQLVEQLAETRETATGVAGPTFRPRPAYSGPLRNALRVAGVPWAIAFDESVRGPDAPLGEEIPS